MAIVGKLTAYIEEPQRDGQICTVRRRIRVPSLQWWALGLSIVGVLNSLAAIWLLWR